MLATPPLAQRAVVCGPTGPFRLLAGEIALVEPLSLLAAALILGLVLCVFVPLRRLPLLSKQR
jgi:hypothetical protein